MEIDHIAVIVKDIEKSINKYKKIFSNDFLNKERVDSEKVDVAFFNFGKANLELVAPLTGSILEKYLEKKGEGLHHIAFKVNNLDNFVSNLKQKGVKFLTKEPKLGAHNKRIIFIHPKELGILVELCEEGR